MMMMVTATMTTMMVTATKTMMNKKGAVLIYVFLVIAVLTVLGGAMLSKAVSERSLAQKYVDSTQAFWAAEAGVNRAFKELSADSEASGEGLWSDTLNAGRYSVDVEVVDSNTVKITSRGFVPADSSRVERFLEVTADIGIPPDFFDNAIYCAGDVRLNGNTYEVEGNVRYGGEINDTEHIEGTTTEDSTINPLAMFNFSRLLEISEGQDNVYVEENNQLVKESTGEEAAFPGSFWYTEGVPNVVYIKGDLSVNKSDTEENTTIGGFFVVAGDIINDSDAEEDAALNGNVSIDGLIYARGEVNLNGGAGNLNIDGGIWGGEEVDLNGNTAVAYNQSYMDAVDDLGAGNVEMTNWKDPLNPYILE